MNYVAEVLACSAIATMFGLVLWLAIRIGLWGLTTRFRRPPGAHTAYRILTFYVCRTDDDPIRNFAAHMQLGRQWIKGRGTNLESALWDVARQIGDAQPSVSQNGGTPGKGGGNRA